MDERHLIAIVPARNEQATVGTVVADLIAILPSADILVVNDGSSDGTAAVARQAGARVLDLPFHSGVGAAMRLGYRIADREGYEWTLRVDADGQHTASSAAEVLAAAKLGALDLTIGIRSSDDDSMPHSYSPRRIAMLGLAAWVSQLSGVHVSDATSGLRVTSAACTALFAKDYPSDFMADTVEPIALAAREGLRIGTCPVQMLRRRHGASSHGPVSGSFHVARTLIALAVAPQRH
jgi:glycosyltransferase involved in cell wall biosynthesis